MNGPKGPRVAELALGFVLILAIVCGALYAGASVWTGP